MKSVIPTHAIRFEVKSVGLPKFLDPQTTEEPTGWKLGLRCLRWRLPGPLRTARGRGAPGVWIGRQNTHELSWRAASVPVL